MNERTCKIIAGVAAGWIAGLALATAQETPAADSPDASTTEAVDTNAPILPVRAGGAEGSHAMTTRGVAEQGLMVHLRGVSLDQALNYLADSAGYTIVREVDTRQYGDVDIDSTKPLDKEAIVALLNKVIGRNGLTAVADGNTLEIETVEMATTLGNTPVKNFPGNYKDVPADATVETEIIPLHSLNPTQVAKDLATLRPPDASLAVSEGGNAIIMTAKRSDIRRFTQIIQSLDSSGNGALEVFLLTYADSKSIADELKDVFASADGNGQQGSAVNLFGGRGGPGFGGPGQGGNGGGASDTSAKRSGIKVNAVSDDQNNAVLVSAPSDMMPDISNLISKLDLPQEDTIQIRVFHLVHADPSDIATELASVFPDPSASGSQATQRSAAQFGQGGPGGFGGGFGAAAGSGTGSGPSSRALKQTTVYSTPDARTQSIIVTASQETMAEIAKMIEDLDSNPARVQQVFVYRPQFVDVMDMQGPLQDLFSSSSGKTSSSASFVNALQNRAQQAAQQSTLTQSGGSSGMGSQGGSGSSKP